MLNRILIDNSDGQSNDSKGRFWHDSNSDSEPDSGLQTSGKARIDIGRDSGIDQESTSESTRNRYSDRH